MKKQNAPTVRGLDRPLYRKALATGTLEKLADPPQKPKGRPKWSGLDRDGGGQ
jgi:hypothetical protein